MNRIQLIIPTLAVPKGRPRFYQGVTVTPQKTRSFEAELRWHWTQSKHPMLPKCPTMVSISFCLPMPKTLAKKKVKPLHPITKPDLDNVAKAILDGLNGFAWPDDNQIWHLVVAKHYTMGAPNIELLIQWEEK